MIIIIITVIVVVIIKLLLLLLYLWDMYTYILMEMDIIFNNQWWIVNDNRCEIICFNQINHIRIHWIIYIYNNHNQLYIKYDYNQLYIYI